MKQFVKDTGIHKILELYTTEEYLKLFTEKKVKNKASKAFTLKDSSDEDISTKARLKMDWKSIKENYLDANHMHNNADEYYGIQVENDSDSYHDDMPHGCSKSSPSTDFVAMSAFKAHCLNNFKESPDQHSITLHSSQPEREIDMDSEVPLKGRSLNERIDSNLSRQSDESDRSFGVLYGMFTSGKCKFSFPKLFEPSNGYKAYLSTTERLLDEILLQATQLVTWESMQKLESRVIDLLKEFLVKYREWEDRNLLVKDPDTGIHYPTKEASFAYNPTYW